MPETPRNMSQPARPALQKPTSFLSLPAELRNKICYLALPKSTRIVLNQPKFWSKKKQMSGIQAVTGQVGLETSAIYFGNNIFRLKSAQVTRLFLDFLGRKRCAMIGASSWSGAGLVATNGTEQTGA